MDGEQPENEVGASEEEEEPVRVDPFVIPEEYVYSTYLVDTDTGASIEPSQVGDKLGALNDDCIVVLRRQEVLEWFSELPAEESPPKEAGMVKAGLASGDVAPQLLAYAYHYKVASLGHAEVADLEAQAERRIFQAKENEEHLQRMLDAGEQPDEDDLRTDTTPLPPLSEKRNFLIFQNYPSTLEELQVLQNYSWAPPTPPTRLLSLDTILVVNSKHPFKAAAEPVDPKAGKPDPKKAKAAKGKGKEPESTEGKPNFLPQIISELRKLDEQNKQDPLRDVFVHTFTLKNTWFGTALSETEDEVYDRLFTNISDLDEKRRRFAKWCVGKRGRELCVPQLADLDPAPPERTPTPPPPVEPTKPAKGGSAGKKNKGEEEPPPPEAPKEPSEPQQVYLPSDIPCHRRYYNTLSKKVKGQPGSLPAVVCCIVEQIIRNEECRRLLRKQREPTNEAEGEAQAEHEEQPGAEPVTDHDVEVAQETQQKAPYEDTLLDYVDYVLGMLDGNQIVEAKRKEKQGQKLGLEKELSSSDTSATLGDVFTSAKVAEKLFRLGQRVEVVVGEQEGYVGSVVGHCRGRVGVELVDGTRLGALPVHLKVVTPKEEEGVVRYGDNITLRQVGTSGHVRGATTLSLELQALELISDMLVPSFDREVTPDTSDLPPLPVELAGSDPTAVLSEEQVDRTLVLLALEQLFHDTAMQVPAGDGDEDVSLPPRASFADHIYTEELTRSVLLQCLADEKYSGKETAHAWYDEAKRQALIVNYHQFNEDRYRWGMHVAEFTGKVYFCTWNKWAEEVYEYERVPVEYVREPSEGGEEEEEEELEPEEGEVGEGAEEEKPEEPKEQQEVVQYVEPVKTPEDHMNDMRKKAQIIRIKKILEDGPMQHLYSPSLSRIEEHTTRLYPSDGALVNVSLLKGNTASHQTTVQIDDVVAALKVTHSPQEVALEEVSVSPEQEDTEPGAAEADAPPPVHEVASNPISFTTSFADTSTLNVSSAVSDGAVQTTTEYCTAKGLHVRVMHGGEIEISNETKVNVPMQELVAGEPATIVMGKNIIEPVPKSVGDRAGKEIVRVFDAATNKVVCLLLKEVSRRVVGASVVRTMEDGTVATLMYDGCVASLHHGSWLVSDGKTVKVLRYGASEPETVCDMLSSSNRDTVTKAMITTREDLTIVVSYDLDDGASLVAHSDGTSIYTKQTITVTGTGIQGDFKQKGFSNGHPSYHSGTHGLVHDGQKWIFSNGASLEEGTLESGRWFKNGKMQHDMKVLVSKQCRIEREGHPSVEVLEGQGKKQINTDDGTIVQWNRQGEVAVHKQDFNALRIALQQQVVQLHPASLAEGQRDSDVEGVYVFNMLTGAVSVQDPDRTRYEVSALGRARVTFYDAMAENHPGTEHEAMMAVDEPPSMRFFKACFAGDTLPEFATESGGTLTIVPRQKEEGLVEGGIKLPHVTHPPTLYLVDMKKGCARRYMAPEDVVRHFRILEEDKEGSQIVTNTLPSDERTEEIVLTTKHTSSPDLSMTEKLIPKIVLETQSKAKKSRLGAPSHGRVANFVDFVTEEADGPQARDTVVVRRRLVKGTVVSDEEVLMLQHDLKKVREAQRMREEHANVLKVVDDQQEEEKEEEKEVQEMLEQVIKKREERALSSRHAKNKEEVSALASEEVSFWHTEEGLRAVEQCLEENEKYKSPPAEPTPLAKEELPLVPQPPPHEEKQDAAPHPTPSPPPRDFHSDLARLEPIVAAGPHKTSLDSVKTLLRQNAPPDAIRSVFEALCILLDEQPTWAKAQQLVTSPTFYPRLLNTAANRDWLPGHILPALLPYTPLLQPESVATMMWELAALSNWVLSFVMYLDVLREVGGPGALGRRRDEESGEASQALEKGKVRDVYGNVRGEIMVKSLKKGGAHSDPNTGYMGRESGVARKVKVCGNTERHRKVVTDLRGSRVVLDPLDTTTQTQTVVTPAALHLGCLIEGSKYTTDLHITNLGQLGVRFNVKRVEPTTAQPDLARTVQFSYKKGPIAPGMSCRVQVVLTVDRLLPDIDTVITFVTESSVIRVPLTATVRPGSEHGTTKLSPNVRNLGNVRLPQIV